jgi:hypothetical protein
VQGLDEEMSVMMELNVTLEFACCGCEQSVGVTVQCSGKGTSLWEVEGALATVKVPCPTCGQVNQLFFEPSGRVHSVRLYSCIRLVPEPSVN